MRKHGETQNMGRGGGDTPFPLVAREKTEIVLVHADDWAGIYLDGELHLEDTEDDLSIDAVLKEVGFKRSETSISEVHADLEWWENEVAGCLPELLEDVVLDDDA